eukprot:1026994-Rhodomonas_salina.2
MRYAAPGIDTAGSAGMRYAAIGADAAAGTDESYSGRHSELEEILCLSAVRTRDVICTSETGCVVTGPGLVRLCGGVVWRRARVKMVVETVAAVCLQAHGISSDKRSETEQYRTLCFICFVDAVRLQEIIRQPRQSAATSHQGSTLLTESQASSNSFRFQANYW